MPMLGKAALLVIPFALIAPGVQASPECMTKQEARAKWPTKPIYQHGSSRCRNEQPLSSRTSTTPSANASDSGTKTLPRPKPTKTEIFLPSVTVNDIDLLNGASMTDWRVIIGIHDLIGIKGQAPDPNNSVDGCCWPSLDVLKALMTAVK